MLLRPTGPYRLNRAHPLGSLCTLLVAPEGDNVVDLVTGNYGVKAVAASLSTAYTPAFGKCLKSVSGSASGIKFVSAQSAAKISTSGLFFGAIQFTNATTAASFFATSSASNGMRLEINSGNIKIFQTGSTSTTATMGLVADVPYFLSILFDGSGSSVVATRLDSGYTIRGTAAAIGSITGDQTLVVAGRVSGATALPGYLGLTGYISDGGAGTGLQKGVQEALHLDPWGLIRPDGYRRIYFTDAPAGGGAVNTNVTLSPAAFTYTPASLTPKTNRLVSLTGPSFSYTPNSLTAVTSRKATLSPVSYSLSVQSLSAVTGRKVTLSPAAFTYTPNSLTTLLTRKVTLSPVSWSWTINDLTAAFVGKIAYAVTLNPVAFTYTPRSLEALYSSPQTSVSRGKTGPKAGPFRGPYDLSKRRWVVRPTKREEDDAAKALVEAQQALEAAQEATKAKARQEAIARVFRALEAVGAEQEVSDAKAAMAEAQAIKAAKEKRAAIEMELSELQRFITEAVEEMEAMRRQRRREEEEFIMRLLLN